MVTYRYRCYSIVSPSSPISIMRGVWLPLSCIPSFLVLTAILSNGDGRCPLPFTGDPAGVGAVPGAPEAGEMVVCLDSDVKTHERMKRKKPCCDTPYFVSFVPSS